MSIATININGITAHMKAGMLAEFIRRHDFDIVYIQEVRDPGILTLQGYETHLNIGTTMRGTAIMAKRQHVLTNIRTIPSGRAISAQLRDVTLINIYAPSGSAHRTEREKFFNAELIHILQEATTQVLLGGDFNCVLHPSDTTGQYHTSRALAEIIRGMTMTDA